MAFNKHTDLLDDSDWFDGEDEDTQKDRYLSFSIGREQYGIGIEHVTEIICIQKITEVPDMPGFVRGVINLRGQVIPVIDVRTRFHLPKQEYDERTCIIVVNMSDIDVGLIVDRVHEVVNIPADSVSPPPRIAKGHSGRFISGLGQADDQVRILLDVNKILFEEELSKLVKTIP